MNRKFRKGDLVKYNTSYIIPPSIEHAVENGLMGIVRGYDIHRNVIVRWNNARVSQFWNQKFLKKVK